MGEAESRRPWYERFGTLGGLDSPTQSMSSEGIPVPPGGTFQGRPPRGRRATDELAAADLEERWSAVSRADRTAEVTEVSWLTATGTLRLGFEVTDDRPFVFVPGNFVRVEAHVPDRGYFRGTYCIASPPSEYRRFDLLVRVVPNGRMSQHLASLRLGDEVAFRGPTGRSMPKLAGEHDLVLVGTGVGIAPLYSLSSFLLRGGSARQIDLFWGLRSVQDICLTDRLDRLADAHQNFRYRISLSEPPDEWTGLRGRVTETMPPLIDSVADRRFILSGNGAMIEEVAVALAELGVPRETIYEEPYFNARVPADPDVVAAMLESFAATDGDEATARYMRSGTDGR